MPIYDFQCYKCNRRTERMCSFEESQQQNCNECDSLMDRCFSPFSRTPGQWGGDTGYYDRALGTYVENYKHRDKLMKEKGLIHMDDDMIRDEKEAELTAHAEHEKTVSRFNDEYKKTGSFAEATSKTFPHQDKWSN